MQLHRLIDWIKDRKTWWMETQANGDMSPIVLAKGDGFFCVVTSPEGHKQYALQAIEVLRTAFNPHTLVFIGDAHCDTATSIAEHQERYPNGMQHACDEDHACATTSLSDCMMATIIRGDKHDVMTIPYAYVDHDTKREVVWNDDKMSLPFEYKSAGGQIIEDERDSAVRSTRDRHMFRQMARKMGLDPDNPNCDRAIQSAAINYLLEMGYVIEDEAEFRRTIFLPQGERKLSHKPEFAH